MKTIFDVQTADGLIARVRSLQPGSRAQWGKMNVCQMMKHCILSEDMFQGKTSYKRLFIGRLFGSSLLKGILKNEEPLKKNQPTHPAMKVKGAGGFETEQNKWISLLEGYRSFSNTGFVHPFFGKMSKDEIGKYVYKHTDHHLRQFNH